MPVRSNAARRYEDPRCLESPLLPEPPMSTDDIVMRGHFGTLPGETRRTLLEDASRLGIEELFARTELLLSLSAAGMPA